MEDYGDEIYEAFNTSEPQTEDDFYGAVEAQLSEIKKTAFGAAGPIPIWYWAGRDRKSVEVTLQGQPEGTYLIRDSTSAETEFVLSVSENKKVSHYIIQRTGPASFTLSEKSFPNIPKLIEFYRLHVLEKTCLTSPLPPSEAQVNGKRIVFYLEVVRAKYNKNAQDPEDLAFRKGDLLNVYEKHEKDWWKAQSSTTLDIGVIPVNYIEFVEFGPKAKAENEAAMASGDDAPPPIVRRGGAAPPPSVPRRAPVPQGPSQAEIDAMNAEALAEHRRAVEEAEEQKRQFEAEMRDKEERARKETELNIKRTQAAYKPPERPKFIVAKAKMDRFANSFDKTALTFKDGDKLHVSKQYDNGLWVGGVTEGKRRGRKGHFPFTMVEILDSAAFDPDIRAIEIAFKVNELKKQGVDILKLLKKSAKPPKVIVPPPPVPIRGAPAAAAAAPVDDYGEGEEYTDMTAPSGGGGFNKGAPPAPPPGSSNDHAAAEIAEEEEDMIYGMADSFDAGAVDAMMEEIYGVL
eukprot:gene8550-29861_t